MGCYVYKIKKKDEKIMKIIKNLLCVMIVMFAFSASSYAVEYSLGFSTGGGFPIFRGEDDYSKNIDDLISSIDDNPFKRKVTIDTSIDVMVAFLPYLALETGIGYKFSSYMNMGGSSSILSTTTATGFITRNEVYIPIMLRGQYEYKIGVTYLSAGVKMGFGLSDYHDLTLTSAGIIGGLGVQATIKQSPISLDVAFSLGQEFKVKERHFLGLRVNYDLNVVAPYAVSDRDDPKEGTFFNDVDFSHDDFSVEFTYRYVFGRNG